MWMWLLDLMTFQNISKAQQSGNVPTSAQEAEYTASIEARLDVDSRILSIAGDTAEISIKGILTKAPSFLAMLFGGGNTTYKEIVSAVASAEQDQTISKIVLAIDSPGGQIDGLFEAIDALKGANKPIEARVSNIAASAAYALASQADTITATNRAARVGSVGIVATFYVEESEIELTSTEAPDKRPDVTTEEGKAVVVKQLDDLHAIFAGDIAAGRNTTVETVNTNFGKGAIMLAQDALDAGMIDAIAAPVLSVVAKNSTTAKSGNNMEVHEMTLAEFKAAHPEIFAEAVKLGADQEHDIVCAHLTMGKGMNAMDVAIKAVEERQPMTAKLNAEYMTAGMNANSAQARGADDGATAAALDGAPAVSAEGDEARDDAASADLLTNAANGLGVTLSVEA